MAGVTAAGGTIAWEARGPEDAPVIVLIHSLGSDRSMWAPQLEALSDRHRLLAVDIRGHGASTATPAPYSMERLGLDVLAVADAAGAERFHVCGLSIGGQVALWLGVNRPERLLSLSACNTAARIGSEEGWRERIEAVRRGGLDSIRESVIERWFAPGFADRHPDWHERAHAVFAATEPEGYIGCCGALAGCDLRDEVGAIEVPTLVIGADLDRSTPPEQAEWLHRRIRGSELTIFEQAAHISNLDQPEAFSARLREFVAERGLFLR